MRILIVDDSRFTRALLRREFDGAYDVDEAGNGREAIEFLRKHDPGIVLVDLLMPIMNGYEFVKEARRLGYQGPLVVCSANTQASVEAQVLEIGATEFVTKPELLVPGKARAVVEEVLRRGTPDPARPVPPPRHLEGLISDAVQALAEAVTALSSAGVRIVDTMQGRSEDLPCPRHSEGNGFQVRLALGNAVGGAIRIQFEDEAGPGSRPLTPRTATGAPPPDQTGFRLVQDFVQRFARRSGRELSVTGMRCAAEDSGGPGDVTGCSEIRLVAQLALSGSGGGGTLDVLGGHAAWARLQGAVPHRPGRR